MLGSLAAQVDPEAPTPTTRDAGSAWTEFRQQHGAEWTARFHKATGTPSRIHGTGLRIADPGTSIESADHATAAGLEFLTQHRDLLGLGRSALVEATTVRIGSTWVLQYDQTYRGLDVIGGRADVRLRDNGIVAMFGSIAVEVPTDLRLQPTIDRDRAFALACDGAGVETDRANRRAPRALVLWADTAANSMQTARLAWQVTVDARTTDGGEFTLGRAFVDAHSGDLLAWKSDVYECGFGHRHVSPRAYGGYDAPARSDDFARDRLAIAVERRAELASARPIDLIGTVMGWVNTSPNGLATPVNVPLPDIRVDGPGGTFTFTDENGNFVLPFAGTAPQTVSVELRGRHIQDIVPSQGTRLTASAQVTPGVPTTLQLSTPGAGEFDLAQMNAYWWTTEVNNYLRSVLGNVPQLDTASNIVATVNIDVIQSGPQTIPGCNAFYGGNSMLFMSLEPQPGADCNNTAFSTVVTHEWGHGLDDRFGGITQQDGLSEGWGDLTASYQSNQPIIGQGFFTNGGAIRTAANNSTVPPGGFPPEGTLPPHPQGEVWAGFAWDVRNGLIASLGQSAGIARAEQIVLASVVANAQNQDDAVFEVFVLDDDDGNLLNGTPNYDVLSNAALTRGHDFPEINLGTITHQALADTNVQLTPRLVEAAIVPLGDTLSATELVFDAGAGTVRRPMLQFGPFNYRALLPGVRTQDVVSYHIEATRTDGEVLRFPETGEISYTVADEVTLFADDFESGAPGWTSQQIATQNDWQLGTPNGSNGVNFPDDFGIDWSDPSSAFSGSNVFGNDLGPQGFNGAYQNNVSNFLQSPSIDLTGATAPLLRFQRWLSVEEGQFDQATISANGVELWANPISGELVDTAWTLQDVSLAAFVGQSVSLRWNLVTDGGLQLGGWNLDDVTIIDQVASSPLDVELDFSPVQVAGGSSTTMSIRGAPNAPVALLISLDPTPVSIPGIVDLAISPPFADVALNLDAQGELDLALPIGPTASSSLVYLQVVQVDGLTLETSNLGILLLQP